MIQPIRGINSRVVILLAIDSESATRFRTSVPPEQASGGVIRCVIRAFPSYLVVVLSACGIFRQCAVPYDSAAGAIFG